MENFIEKYQEMIKSKEFNKFKKDLASSLDQELEKNDKEVETVKNWVETINKQTLTTKNQKIDVNSLFIHGFRGSEKGSSPSGVEFDYYGNTCKRELADIIFISSFYYQHKKVFEKATINQAKWSNIKTTNRSWKIEEGQFYLLSRLPVFKGINGSIIKNEEYCIDNMSKCLTSYGLMNKENFVFVSTNNLLTAMGGKKSINLKDFQYLNCLDQNTHVNIPFYHHRHHYHEFFHFLEKYCCKYGCCVNTLSKLFFNTSTTFTNNTYEFVSEYLKGNIGETIHNSMTNLYNKRANILIQDIMKNINEFATTTNNENAVSFIKNYNFIEDSNDNNDNNMKFDKGFGIVQIKIHLDE